MLKIVGHLGRAFRSRRQNRSSAYTPAELEAPHDQQENTKPATHEPRSACQNHSLSTTNAAGKIRPLSPNLCPRITRGRTESYFVAFSPNRIRHPTESQLSPHARTDQWGPTLQDHGAFTNRVVRTSVGYSLSLAPQPRGTHPSAEFCFTLPVLAKLCCSIDSVHPSNCEFLYTI